MPLRCAFFMLASAMPLPQVPGHVGERKTIQRLARMNRAGIDQRRHVGDTDVAEGEVANGGNALVAGDGELVLLAAVQHVDAQESGLHPGDIKVVGYDVLDKRATSGSAL